MVVRPREVLVLELPRDSGEGCGPSRLLCSGEGWGGMLGRAGETETLHVLERRVEGGRV